MNFAREIPRSFNHASISANVSLRRRTENEVYVLSIYLCLTAVDVWVLRVGIIDPP